MKTENSNAFGILYLVVDVLHPGAANVSKADIREKLAAMYKVKDTKCIAVFGLHTSFGGGKSSGMGLVYESLDKVKQFEPKHRCKRHGIELPVRHKRIGRRNFKKMKGNLAKAPRGKKKTEVKKTF